jgi:hypothetical protein
MFFFGVMEGFPPINVAKKWNLCYSIP